MNKIPTSNSGWLKGLVLTGLVGLLLGWGVNQWVAWQVGERAAHWVPAPLPKILPRLAETEPSAPVGPVEFGPGIIEEQTLPAQPPLEEASPSTPSKKTRSKDASAAPKVASPKSAPKPSIPTRGFTVDREALRTQFKNPSDLYRHGHYAPNEVDGVRRGLRFLAVAPGGVFARLGFQPGDVVLSVNGAPLNNQNDVLANFEKMRKMSVLNMRLERDGKPLQHRYILK